MLCVNVLQQHHSLRCKCCETQIHKFFLLNMLRNTARYKKARLLLKS